MTCSREREFAGHPRSDKRGYDVPLPKQGGAQ